MTTVCIPTLNAIDDFWKCVESIEKSSIGCSILAIDNGGLVNDLHSKMLVHKPASNLGVAASWNWFIENTRGYRIITNDDIIFNEYAIESMLLALAKNRREGVISLIAPENLGSPFSCFLLPDEVVEMVGKFDESISPQYAYFEDDDYSYRMSLKGIGIMNAGGSTVHHAGSTTIGNFDPAQMESHHRKFRAARDRYIRKWGGQPREERFTEPFNGAR